MLVKDLSASSSTGHTLLVVLCYQNCIINLHIVKLSLYAVIVQEFRSNNNKYGMFMSNIIIMFSGIGKGKWRMLEGRGNPSLDKNQLIYNPTKYKHIPTN
jgi:hypothetical protein